MKQHPCETCKKPTDLRGWYAVSLKPNKRDTKNRKLRFKKINVWWCKEHYLTNMFSLWPFTCTAACRAKVGKKLGLQLEEKDLYVWMSTITCVTPAGPGVQTSAGMIHEMRPTMPKCPRCGKGMKLADMKLY